MPVVEVSLPITAPPQLAWETVIDIERYPDRMESVRSVSILERSADGRRLSAWSVLLKGSVLEWTEADVLDHDRRRVTFEQTSGDLQQFSGYWQVDPGPDGGSEITLYVEFDIGIPLLAEMLNPVAATALADNARQMLLAIGRSTTETPVLAD